MRWVTAYPGDQTEEDALRVGKIASVPDPFKYHVFGNANGSVADQNYCALQRSVPLPLDRFILDYTK